MCGADAVMVGTPLAAADGGARPRLPLGHHRRPRHPPARATEWRSSPAGSLEEILVGPAHEADGQRNLLGALRRSMALCGYESLKDFQKAEVVALS